LLANSQGGLGDLAVDSNNYVSAKAYLGLQGSYAASEKLSANARLFYAHEFGDNHYDVNASFLNLPTTGFKTRGAKFGRDSVIFGLGASYQLSEGTRLFLDYNINAMESQISQGLNAGISFQW